MENRLISASVSTQSVTFQPGGEPAWFDVIVNNDSNQFADFQLEILAAGSTSTPEYRWYILSPEVASAQPPGSTTPFRILIQDTPVPAFVGTVNLTVRIYSPQLRTETRLVVRLKIEQGDRPTLLSVELPVVRVQVYPQNSVDVPVRVRNLGQRPIDVVLNFLNLDPSWIVKPLQRRVMVDPLGQAETTFQCQPPSANKVLSQDYIYTVEATTSQDNISANAQGILEVLPVGFVEFSVEQPQKQIIPNSRRWLPNWKSKSTTFKLLFKNASNLQQYVNVEVQGRDYRKCHFQVIPENAELNIGETTPVLLKVTTKRPWIGWGKTLLLEAKSILSNPSLGSTDPATRILELRVLPIIPLWLQAVLALLAALLLLWPRPSIVTHTDQVVAVRFNGRANEVVSGSKDCTLRIWIVDSNSLKPHERVSGKAPVACGKPQNPKGLLGVTNVPVYSLRFMSEGSNRVAAGLENGKIQLWDLNRKQQIQELNLVGSNGKKNFVFDLLFTKDSRSLLSGDASGKILLWERSSPNNDFAPNYKLIIDLDKQINQTYQIQALALSPDEKTLVAAGSYRSFFIISNWNTNSPRVLEQKARDGQGTTKDNYIHSIAFAPGSPNLLATSDSFGFIKIWDLKQCLTNAASKQQTQENCVEQLDSWDAGSGVAVRSIAFVNFNRDDGGKLVSAGDDKRVMLWYLTPEGKLDKKISKGKTIDQNSKEFSAIDSADSKSKVVSGGVDHQVKLHPIK
jgi:WD40 repeat protein